MKKILKTGKLKGWALYKDIARRQHELTYLFWECTLRCNFFCRHCGSDAGGKTFPDELSTEEIKKTFREIAEDFDSRKIFVAVTGGEPLLRKDLFDVMSFVRKLGFEWGMVTNGFLVDEEAVKKMKESGMSTVVVSLDGIGETHDGLRGKVGAFEKAVQAVKRLAAGKFLKNLQITTTINRLNISELEKMYEVFLSLGIDSWRVFNIDPIGRAEVNEELLLTAPELKKILEFIKEKRKTAPIDVTYGCSGFLGLDFEGEVRDQFFNCATGINVGSVLHNGDIYVCPNVPRRREHIQGNVRRDKFSKIWNEDFKYFRDKNRTSCGKCRNCEWWRECLGEAMHNWDFEKKSPKLCHWKMIKDTYE